MASYSQYVTEEDVTKGFIYVLHPPLVDVMKFSEFTNWNTWSSQFVLNNTPQFSSIKL